MTVTSAAPTLVNLRAFDLDVLQEVPSTIHALTPDLRIGYVNEAWTQFALANGAQWKAGDWGTGRPIMDAIPAVLRPFYRQLFARALTERRELQHDYECSSATTTRRFCMRLVPCTSGGLIVVHSSLRIPRQAKPAMPPLDELYLRAGVISQCSHCRRVQRASEPGTWDWVPSYVARPRRETSHGLCSPCADHYYPVEASVAAAADRHHVR